MGFYLSVEYSINGSIFSGFPLDDRGISCAIRAQPAAGSGSSYSGTEKVPPGNYRRLGSFNSNRLQNIWKNHPFQKSGGEVSLPISLWAW